MSDRYTIPSLTPIRWAGPNRTIISVVSPNDGKTLGEVEQISAADVEWLAGLILVGQDKMNTVQPRERAQWLKKIAQLIREERAELAHLIATEGGKPLKDALVETDRAAHTFELCAEETVRLGSDTLPLANTAPGEGKLAFTLREPIGPVLALSAFNHPLNLLAHQVGTALAAGCAVVFKPSRGTPYCGEWLAEALTKAGVPAEAAIICHADREQIHQLVSRPEFQFVSFVGSAQVGWDLRKKIAPGTRLALEHGGQVCISTQKIFVHEKVATAFISMFAGAASKLITGDARHKDTDVGPLIRPAEKQRVHQWVQEALEAGATLAHGVLDNERFMKPIVLTNVPVTCKIWHEEVFGPVVSINSFSDVSKAYEDIEESPFHFEACIFTQSLPRALEAVKHLAAMTVVVNEATTFRVDAMPFGGHRQAGLGMGGVHYAVSELTRLKQVIINGF